MILSLGLRDIKSQAAGGIGPPWPNNHGKAAVVSVEAEGSKPRAMCKMKEHLIVCGLGGENGLRRAGAEAEVRCEGTPGVAVGTESAHCLPHASCQHTALGPMTASWPCPGLAAPALPAFALRPLEAVDSSCKYTLRIDKNDPLGFQY